MGFESRVMPGMTEKRREAISLIIISLPSAGRPLRLLFECLPALPINRDGAGWRASFNKGDLI
jgi:hypothetical protein